jgi:hypothetical protein
MVAICLVTAAAGAIGWNMHRRIARKKFTASIEKLHSRLSTCRRLSFNCQADWRCSLAWNGKSWALASRCVDRPQSLPSLDLGSFLLILDGEKKNTLTFDFTSTGEVLPGGVLQLQNSPEESKVEWRIPDIFFLEEGTKSGPVHPEEAVRQRS